MLARRSDYQTGAWDTDAAENIAYDTALHRAFIASAETGVVKVVDMSNPTSITEIGTLNVGTHLSTQCMEVDCVYERMDFGGRHNPCGYASVLQFVTNYGVLNASAGTATGAEGSWDLPGCERRATRLRLLLLPKGESIAAGARGCAMSASCARVRSCQMPDRLAWTRR